MVPHLRMTARLREWATKARHKFSGPGELALLARMVLWTVALRMLKHSAPLPRLVALVRRVPSARPRNRGEERRIVTLARWAARLTQWRAKGTCLERALVTYRYLMAANASPMLVIGITSPEDSGAVDATRGHAWVTTDGQPVEPSDDALERFAPVISFGPDGRAVHG